jgi:2-polyprenyl-6-methoxyphenol hydroxylase-like FAD-dependent oxidoreductase
MQAMGVDISGDDAPSTSHYTFSQQGEIIGFFGEAFGVKSKDRQEVQNSGRFIHIPRQVLRQRILEAVRPDTIRWNSKLKSYDDSDKDKVTVTLIDDTKIEGALLIGSDGIFSTVRRQLELPGDRLNYVGLCVVLGIVNDEILKIPLAKRRIFETVDGTTRIYAMPFTKNSTMWQLSFPCSEDTARKYTRDASTLKAEISRRCGNWHDPIPEMLTKTPLTCMSGYPVYDRELLETDVLRPKASISRRVTIIGDAAHPMTPFKAQGANQAISDAVLFADTLIEGVGKHGSVNGFNYALPLFEKKMLSRSSRAVLGSREKAKEMHSNLALQPARKAQREAEFDLRTVLRSLKEKQITASRATDKEGLDALVLAVCGGGRPPSMANGNGEGSTHTNIVDFQGTKVRFNDDDEEQENKIDRTKKRKKAEKKEKKEKKEKSKKQKK